MKLIDILVEELPKRGGWPKSANCITQDPDKRVEHATCQPGVAKFNSGCGQWFLNGSRTGGFSANTLASDYTTAIITREQYEAALAAKNDGWIEWGGGKCPVDDGEVVDVMFGRGGRISTNIAECWCWIHRGTSSDITAYRLHQPKKSEQAESDDEADLNECIGQDAAPAWNGEGLPPVGCECEYSLNGGKTWWKCKIDYIVGTQGVVMLCDTFEGVQYVQFSSYGNSLKFRPIRSEADRKRDEAVKTIMLTGWCQSFAEEIYDLVAAGKMPGMKLED